MPGGRARPYPGPPVNNKAPRAGEMTPYNQFISKLPRITDVLIMPRKKETLRWFNVGPTSTTLAQH